MLNGLYHVLGGTLSPLDGIGPEDLTIAKLIERAGAAEVKEVLLALNATVEGQIDRALSHRAARRPATSPSRGWRMACRSAASSITSTKARSPPPSRPGKVM